MSILHNSGVLGGQKILSEVSGSAYRHYLNLKTGDVGYFVGSPARVPFTVFKLPGAGASVAVEYCFDSPEAVLAEIRAKIANGAAADTCKWVPWQSTAGATAAAYYVEAANFSAVRFTSTGGPAECGLMHSQAT